MPEWLSSDALTPPLAAPVPMLVLPCRPTPPAPAEEKEAAAKRAAKLDKKQQRLKVGCTMAMMGPSGWF